MFWTVEAALSVPEIDTVYVATDSIRIRETLAGITDDRLKVIDRSAETATDTASSEAVLLEFCNNYEFRKSFLFRPPPPC